MGGEDAVRVVQDLLGHAQHFDFAQVSDRVPKLDLPDLAPFFRLALRQNRRQLTETGGVLAFKTPESWQRTEESDHATMTFTLNESHRLRKREPSSGSEAGCLMLRWSKPARCPILMQRSPMAPGPAVIGISLL